MHHGDERPADEDDDADVVEAVPSLGDLRRRERESGMKAE